MDAIDELKLHDETVRWPAESVLEAGLWLLCGLAVDSRATPLSIPTARICVAAPQHMSDASAGTVRQCPVEAAVQACVRWTVRMPFLRDLGSLQVGICTRVHASALDRAWICVCSSVRTQTWKRSQEAMARLLVVETCVLASGMSL